MAIKVRKVEKDLNIQELLVIESELTGASFKDVNGNDRVVKGILEERLNAAVKIHLLSFIDEIDVIKKSFFKVKEELIKRHAKEFIDEDGSNKLDLSENIDEFRKEEADLLNQTFSIKVPEFDLDDIFNFDTEFVYSYSFKYLVKNEDDPK